MYRHPIRKLKPSHPHRRRRQTLGFQHQFKQVFSIFKGLGSGKPSGRFTIDLKGRKINNANAASLSFN